MRRLLALSLALGLAAPLAAQPMRPDAAPVEGVVPAVADGAEVGLTVRAVAPVSEAGCVGYVDPSAPDVAVDWGGGDLHLTVRGDLDATLAVALPDGTWACDDDGAGSLLPAVTLRGAAAGRYAVWVGAFSEAAAGAAATLVAGPPPPRPTLGAAADALAGRIDAPGGFEADRGPIEVTLAAGGADRASDVEGGCAGYVDAARPSAAVAYAAGGTGTLAVSATPADAEAFIDLVLLVRTPGGAVLCNDDYAGTDPAVTVDDADAGDYTVWVGTFGGGDPADALLTVAETAPETGYDLIEDMDFDFGDMDLDGGPAGPYSEGSYLALRPDAAPAVALAADDAGGSSAAAFIRPEASNPVTGDACTGFIETAPTAGIALDGEGPFALTASADEADLTLTVRTPSGDWWCSDDADGLDPGVQIDDVEAGTYLAWVGTFTDPDEAVEVAVAAEPGTVEWENDIGGFDGPTQSDGAHDGSVLAAGPGQVALAVGDEAEVEAGGPVLNPVDGELCQGFVSAAPTATVAVDGPVAVGAISETDLTLVALGPDGAWTCGDDANGSDPYVVVDGGPGTVTIWVGTFSRRTSPVEAVVYVDPAD